jgi:signal transduction histidine kinase/CheY-like chemotaxis protein
MFDDLVRLAADLVGMPMAAIHLIAEDRQWAKAEIGLDTREMPRSIAFCPLAMMSAASLVVPDATKDPRFATNPLVTGAPGIRFYAGMPLESEGLPIGALCVIDTTPHDGLSERQRFALKTIATQVNAQIALRVALRHQSEIMARREFATDRQRRDQDLVEHELRRRNAALETRIDARTAELADSEQQLRQSLKMEAVGQLTGGLAHDFNNLLTGITGNLELLSARLAQGRIQDLNRYIISARSAADRAASLTHRLLAFSRRQALSPKPILLNRLISELEDLIRRTMGPSIALEVVGAGGLWTALCDPNQMENALLNLCINAHDAMPDGGKLTIETANASLDFLASRQRDIPPGQYVVMCVTDTGIGMSKETIDRAFDPFYTTKPLGEGTGLGLSMVYGFARQSGGLSRIYSELGQGTTVKVYLPRYHGDPDAGTMDEMVHIDSSAHEGETVLVVDDEPSVRTLVGEVLRDLGYAAVEAHDGASAMKVLQSDARIDLLITDVGLPGGMNGRQIADATRMIRPELKVLFITGYAANAAIGNGILGPGMHVMVKPFAMEALAARVRTLIASGS